MDNQRNQTINQVSASIYDKIMGPFAAEGAQISVLRRGVGKIISLFGTDPNRRLSDIIGNPADMTIECNEPSLLHGQYRIMLLRKQCKQ